MKEPFYTYSSYIKKRWGKPVYRVGVDAGFSCPHAAGGGCSYCDSHGGRAAWLRNQNHSDLKGLGGSEILDSLGKQIDSGIEFLKRRYKAEGFILYFQANSNTYAPVEELREIYDFGLARGNFCELAVSTRPDCLSPEKVELLASYQTHDRDVWVELGLQTANDITLKRINRGHTRSEFIEGFRLLREQGIKIVVHLILGLPGEGVEELSETLALMRELKPEGIKLHNLHIPRNTPMYEEFLRGEITAPSSSRHLELLQFAIERIPEDTIVLRLTCDTPGGPGAPRKFWNKSLIFSELKKNMISENMFQGRLSS
ncbi:MAG: TIGR01212 family radical SAM protein [Spirochaetales bacterium]|nr:TIGR01212 family radical SAM protein [Spirochaetales bacterium]